MIYNATAGSETNLKNYVLFQLCNDDLEWPLITAIYLGKQTQINTCMCSVVQVNLCTLDRNKRIWLKHYLLERSNKQSANLPDRKMSHESKSKPRSIFIYTKKEDHFREKFSSSLSQILMQSHVNRERPTNR